VPPMAALYFDKNVFVRLDMHFDATPLNVPNRPSRTS